MELPLNDFKMGYFILVKGRGWLARRITAHQLSLGYSRYQAQFTHVGVSGGGQYIVEVSYPKVRVVDIRERFKGQEILLVKYIGKDYDIKRYKVAFWAASHCNMRYDWLGILKFKLKIIWHWRDRDFCSENAAWALRKEYADALNMIPHECMPARFTGVDFEKIWEGRVDYKLN